MEIAAIIVLLILSALFSGSEIAFVAANRLKVEVFARGSRVVGPIARDFINDPAKLLTTTLVGNNLALVAYSTLMAILLEPSLHAAFTSLGAGRTAVEIATLFSQTMIASIIVLFFGEILPKSILREIPTRSVFALAIPLRTTYYLLLPLIKLAAFASNGLIRLFNIDAETFSQFMRRDFELILEESMKRGDLDLDREESALLSKVLAMNSIRLKGSMVPRTDIKAVDDTMSLEQVRERFLETGHSKLLVYHENIDNIIGVAFAYDLFRMPGSISEIIRPISAVPESKPSKDLLRQFLSDNISVALVVDEYGGTAGLVTLEDLLEELFGDILDEFDEDERIVRKIDDRTLIVSGRVEVDKLSEKFGIDFPEGDYETIAGYLMERLGSIPTTPEQFELDGHSFSVLESAANRIDLVKIILP
ncbi:MAG: HlyC/CorC family transporter [Rhodothermales bacterium]|nr:HlyC/CorC family transporter [Rhodothermales bacterium]